MKSRRSLQSLAEVLPALPRGRFTEESLDPAFTGTVNPPTGYVWPDVEILDGAESPILLVTAPGAMGKSAAARAVASATHAPFIDLAKVPIGGDSLTGLLTRVLGWNQAPDFVKQLRQGDATLVLDSLDEAQLAAGQTHFTAFLANVADLLRGGAAKSQVVIFGRRDTIETATLVLDDLGIEVRHAGVAPLNYTQSNQLIDLVLDDVHLGSARYQTHRDHPVPFAGYRDKVLLDMAQALGARGDTVEDCWDEVGDFLGYPPVLLVMGRHLVVDNPAALNSNPSSHGGMESRGALLREVTEEIMSRESEKVRAQMCAALGFSSGDPKRNLLYTRDEQVVRIISHLTGRSSSIPLPSALTADQAAIYQDQIVSFVPDHPFLRGREVENVVFSDYLKAYAETSELFELHALPTLERDGRSAGPFFAHFVHAMAPTAASAYGDTEAVAVVDERIVDTLVKSFAAGARPPHAFVYSDHGTGSASLFLAEDAQDGEPKRILASLEFHVAETSGLLELTSPVSRGVLVTSGGLSISSNTDEVVIGPDVVLVVGELYLGGTRVTVNTTQSPHHAPNGGALIVSRGAINHSHDLRLNVHPAHALKAFGDNLWHQWHPYRLEMRETEQPVPSQLSWQVIFGMRRILSVFHASVKDDPSLYRDRLDRFTVGNNPVFSAVLESLIELEVIAREPALYRLRLNRLGEYGVSYAALRGEGFEQALAGLHREVLKSASMRDVILTAREND